MHGISLHPRGDEDAYDDEDDSSCEEEDNDKDDSHDQEDNDDGISEEDGEEDEEGKEDFSSKRRRATCLHCPHAFHIVFISHTPALQRAWNMDIINITQKCSNCFSPNAQYRCACCQLVRNCNLSCQSTASEIPGNV